jgi:hypothetical protein
MTNGNVAAANESSYEDEQCDDTNWNRPKPKMTINCLKNRKMQDELDKNLQWITRNKEHQQNGKQIRSDNPCWRRMESIDGKRILTDNHYGVSLAPDRQKTIQNHDSVWWRVRIDWQQWQRQNKSLGKKSNPWDIINHRVLPFGKEQT